MGARWYDAQLGRWISADTIVPNPANSQSFNRFAYVYNNPLKYVDPSGHRPCWLFCDTGDVVDKPQTPAFTREEVAALVSEAVDDGLVVYTPSASEGGKDRAGETPPVVLYIHREMTSNAQSETVGTLQGLNATCPNGGCRFNLVDTLPLLLPAPDPTIEGQFVKATAYVIFGANVRHGGPWDPKGYIGDNYGYSQQIGDSEYYYDVWGNIMFGYLGKASGFSEAELLDGAGTEQIGSDLYYTMRYVDTSYLPGRKSDVSGMRAYDDPYDQVTTQIGIDLWNTYGLEVTPQHIIHALAANPDPR